MFVQRVKEKEAELKESEKEVQQQKIICILNTIKISFQLHAKFDKLKRDHAEEKRKLEDSRKRLEEDFVEFSRRKTQITSHHTLTLGKNKKK